MVKHYWPITLFSALVLVLFTGVRHLIWNAHFDFHQEEIKGKYTFLIVHRGRSEETEYADQLIRAAKTLGWSGYEVSLTPSGWLKKWIKRLPIHPLTHIVKKMNPHFIISMTKELPLQDVRPSYLLLSHREYDNIETSPKNFNPHRWQGILTSSLLITKLQKIYPDTLPNCIPWYWSSISTGYYKPEPRRVFQLSPHGHLSAAFYKLQSLLDRSGYLDPEPLYIDVTDKIEAIHRSGIALILHSEYQFGSEVPSQNFFNAAAASAVIIADRHPFIEREFQDAVLYIDSKGSGEEMFQNVDTLIEWVWNHQEEASLLAEKAHSIFQSQFTIQKFLTDLESTFA